jgi:hypothetical protein
VFDISRGALQDEQAGLIASRRWRLGDQFFGQMKVKFVRSHLSRE